MIEPERASAARADAQHGALSGLRVLELSGSYGCYCGKLFANLGSEVILIEPPGGSSLRRVGPFWRDPSGIDRSIPFAYFHAEKSSVVLDVADRAGGDAFTELAKTADLLILGDHPGAGRIDISSLREANPALVCTVITPFGRTGPYSHFLADDLVAMAMGGLLYLGGYADGAPTVAYGEQAYRAADQFAAVASLTALLRAEAGGGGDCIDVSMQEAVVMALENAAQTYQLEQRVRRREGGIRRQAGTGIYECKDGEIYLLAGGIGETKLWNNFVRWLANEGVSGASIFEASPWSDPVYLSSAEAIGCFNAVFKPFAMAHTKVELYKGAQRWRVPMAPVSGPADVLASEQLRHRGFFVRDPASGLQMPGAPYKLSATPWKLTKSSPGLSKLGQVSPVKGEALAVALSHDGAAQ